MTLRWQEGERRQAPFVCLFRWMINILCCLLNIQLFGDWGKGKDGLNNTSPAALASYEYDVNERSSGHRYFSPPLNQIKMITTRDNIEKWVTSSASLKPFSKFVEWQKNKIGTNFLSKKKGNLFVYVMGLGQPVFFLWRGNFKQTIASNCKTFITMLLIA